MTTLFKIPGDCTLTTPFKQTHAWAWADSQPLRENVTVKNYLQFVGFMIGQHHLSEDESSVVKGAIEQWHRGTPWIREPRKITELFAQNEHSTLTIWGKPGLYTPSHELLGALVDSGWIKEIKPETTYFEIIEDRLYAKYQTILGSRFLARIKPEEVVKVRAPYGSKKAAKKAAVEVAKVLPKKASKTVKAVETFGLSETTGKTTAKWAGATPLRKRTKAA